MDCAAGLVVCPQRGRRRAQRAGFCAGLLVLLLGVTGCVDPTQPGLTVWVAGGHESILADTPPRIESEIYSASRGEVRLTAAINETVALQVALASPGTATGPLTVRLGELTGPGGTLTHRDSVRVFRANYARVERVPSWYPDHGERQIAPGEIPDILVPWEASRGGGPVRVDGTRNEIIWIDIRVPATIEPGEYSARLEVLPDASAAARPNQTAGPLFGCMVRLRVLPVALPTAPSLPVICRVDAMDLLEAHLRWPRESSEQMRLIPDAPSHRAAIRLINSTMEVFSEHRTSPVLWAAFPKFRPTGEREVEIEWEEYDQIVGPLIDGTAFRDGIPAPFWPVPVSAEFPSAEVNGGFASPQYARLLAAYLAACRQHFQEKGWLDRAFVRLRAPTTLDEAEIDRLQRLTGILRQSESGFPFVAHAPPRSLRGLGWEGAPLIDLPHVDVWAPFAMWSEPQVLARERGLGRRTWLLPDRPPFSGSLAVVAPPNDPRELSWQAFRYENGAIWIEHAADRGALRTPAGASAEPLVYAGSEYGFIDRPMASIRLKRLRLGLQDYELLRMLEQRGKRLMAQELARQLVRWAATEASTDNLLTTREAGWAADPAHFALARDILLQELANDSEPSSVGSSKQIADMARMARIMNQADRVRAEARGVRLTGGAEGFTAHIFCGASNLTNRTVNGVWSMPVLPVGWQALREAHSNVPPDARRTLTLESPVAGLSYNIKGVQPLELQFRTQEFGDFVVPTRLAVAGCPLIQDPPRIDGNLEDWRTATNNVAGDFKLVRGRKLAADPALENRPGLGTDVFLCRDRENLYVGVRAELPRGERPMWRADNVVPVDGAVPWGQDLIEILIDPRSAVQGTSGEIYNLQVKPSGLLIAHKGCRTEPPMGPVQEWRCGARAAVQVFEDAWVVEIALPIAALGEQGLRNSIWGFNVARLDARRGEYSSWSGARGHCYAPEVLGNLILLGQ